MLAEFWYANPEIMGVFCPIFTGIRSDAVSLTVSASDHDLFSSFGWSTEEVS